jgi:glycosyltransferase involved in cell wall biosynthesis
MSSGPVIGYVIRMFPQLSETFVANEILHLGRMGVRIKVYSYRRPTAAVPHECVRLIDAPITYLPDPLYRHAGAIVRAHRACYRRQPEGYRRTLAYVGRRVQAERSTDAWRRFVQAGWLADRAARDGVERLHAHFAHGATRLAMLTGMVTGLRFGFTAHARDIYTANPDLLRAKITAADYVVTCTRANQEHLRRVASPDAQAKIEVGYHGVDLGKFGARVRPPMDAIPLVLSVGRLVRKKGFPDLLHACRVLTDKGMRLRCMIVGDGPERPRLETLVRELGLGGVVSLPGSSSQEELLDVYRRATVFALPCRVLEDGDRDGIPNVLLEAMAVGLPVIASGSSSIRELVRDGDNGILVPERNGDALATALERLLGDGPMRDRLARSARATVAEHFDAVVNVRALAHLLQNGSRPVEIPSRRELSA